MSEEERPAKVQRTDEGGDVGGGEVTKKAKKPKEKKNKFPLRREIDLACRRADADAAFVAMDQAHAAAGEEESEKLEAHSYNAILSLCANGGRMNTHEHSADIPGPEKPLDEEAARALRQRAMEVYEKMQAAKIKPTETTFTALAIMAAKDGDGDRSFEMAKQVAANKGRPKLRTFAPSLHAFCEQGQVDKAFEVDTAISEAEIEPSEAELMALAKACWAAKRLEDFHAVMERVRRELMGLKPESLSDLEAIFAAEGAEALWAGKAAAGGEGEGGPDGGAGVAAGPWKVCRATVSESGTCSGCSRTLEVVDLEPEESQCAPSNPKPEESQALADGILKLASQRENKQDSFKKFEEWLERRGPFKVLIDGANVGMFGQNHEDSAFSYRQVQKLYQYLQKLGLDDKNAPLLVLHQRRTRGKDLGNCGAQVLDQVKRAGGLFTSPGGSNDDWYWLYAAVKAGKEGMLVTNDLMRDHIFQVLSPKYFNKWKQRHQVHFAFGHGGPECTFPPPFTQCIQEVPGAAWHFPNEEGSEWLCAQR